MEKQDTEIIKDTIVKSTPVDQEELTIESLTSDIIKGYGKEGSDEGKKIFKQKLKNFLNQTVLKFHECSNKYNILILHDESTLVKGDADNIYAAIADFTDTKPILLILLSRGGQPGSAYLIGKLCREHAKDGEFIISVPRYAKSAATLLCCAANEIHMGSLSELGPIDPQINNMPTLALKNSIEHIAELVNKNPASSEMFAKYLNLSVEPVQIGYYERVAESAYQYAETLLSTHAENLKGSSSGEIAYLLVHKYKDHGFVIDKEEAKKIFGEHIIKHGTDEYKLGNEIYQALNYLERIFSIVGYQFYFIGSLNSEPTLLKSKKD